jgi:DNA polymerase (family 10)
VLDAASARGYEYIAITEHAEDLVMNGVGREALLEQRAELASLAESYPDMTLLHGIELNIGPEGGLDYDQDFRMSFDWCVAAVHSHFDLDRAAQTARVVRAMQDPAVHVIGHLTGRMIGRRPGIDLDIDAVLEAAGETGTAIEINSALQRLDAATDVLRRARELGVMFVISSDAHHVDQLERTEWGRRQARRGWVDRSRIANTWPRERFLSWIRDSRPAA